MLFSYAGKVECGEECHRDFVSLNPVSNYSLKFESVLNEYKVILLRKFELRFV